MPQDLAFYLLAIPAVLIAGLAKGGFSGMGALGMPMLALAIDLVLDWWFAASVSSRAVLIAVGAISVIFGLYRLWAGSGGRIAAPSTAPAWVGTLFGVATGFTNQIAHAGGPPFQMWVMPRRLPRDVLIGTTAIFFAALNWIKAPACVALGQFTRENVLTTLTLLPFALIGSLAGVLLVRRIAMARFYTLIYVLMVLAGAKLLWDGIAA